MNEYLIFIILAVVLPVIYWAVLQWYKLDFEEEKNQKRIPLRSIHEVIVMIISEMALFKICYDYGNDSISGVMLALIYVGLVIMTILCMTDYWERIVPNKILIIYIFLNVLVIGFQGVKDMNIVLSMIPSMILGLIFCVISFGVAYLVSRGSLGSGDVKLSVLLGLFLTGEYVVGTVFYGCLLSAIYSVVQLWRKRLTRKDEIPFVPFLYMGLIIICLVG